MPDIFFFPVCKSVLLEFCINGTQSFCRNHSCACMPWVGIRRLLFLQTTVTVTDLQYSNPAY